MNSANLARLFALAALWGASFLFMRMAAPTLPPALLMFLRVAIAALFLVVVAGRPRSLRLDVVAVGALNSALPFVLLAFAARSLDAGTLAILNATAPAFAVVAGALATRRSPRATELIGLALGLAGVAFAVGAARFDAVAVGAAVTAALSYGVAAHLAKRGPRTTSPRDTATGSMLAATALLALPALASTSPAALTHVPLSTWLAVIALGIACTGVAYLLYFRLLADVGAAGALSVTFLVPLFAVLWGALFLGETIRMSMALASLLVLAGTALTTGLVGSMPRARPV